MSKFITLGDLLKSEADTQSRESIPANTGTKIGQLVNHPLRGQYLVALSDETNGKVLVQPHNCVIYLDNVALANITSIKQGEPLAPLTVDILKKEGDAHGIKYIGTPYTA